MSCLQNLQRRVSAPSPLVLLRDNASMTHRPPSGRNSPEAANLGHDHFCLLEKSVAKGNPSSPLGYLYYGWRANRDHFTRQVVVRYVFYLLSYIFMMMIRQLDSSLCLYLDCSSASQSLVLKVLLFPSKSLEGIWKAFGSASCYPLLIWIGLDSSYHKTVAVGKPDS